MIALVTLHPLPWPMWVLGAGDIAMLGTVASMAWRDRRAARSTNEASHGVKPNDSLG